MLTLEGVCLATFDLKIQERSKVGYLLLHSSQTNKSIKCLETILIVNSLWSLIRNIPVIDGHQLFVAHHGDISSLQALSLFLAYLIKERADSTSVGKILSTRVVHLAYHLPCQLFCLWREQILLCLSKYKHNLIELIRIIVIDIEEIVETTTESRIDAEEILHLRTIACCNNHKLSSVILHAFHQFFKSLGSLIVPVATGIYRCKGICLIYKENTTHCLIAETIYYLRSLSLIRTNHLCTVYLNNMSAVEISYGSKYLTKFSCYRSLTCSWITCKDDVHRHLLLFT